MELFIFSVAYVDFQSKKISVFFTNLKGYYFFWTSANPKFCDQSFQRFKMEESAILFDDM